MPYMSASLLLKSVLMTHVVVFSLTWREYCKHIAEVLEKVKAGWVNCQSKEERVGADPTGANS